MLLTKLRDPSAGVAARVLTALGELAQVAGEDIAKYLDQLLPMIIEALQVRLDHTRSRLLGNARAQGLVGTRARAHTQHRTKARRESARPHSPRSASSSCRPGTHA